MRQEVFHKKDILKNFAKFRGKQRCQGLFFNKVTGPRQCQYFVIFSSYFLSLKFTLRACKIFQELIVFIMKPMNTIKFAQDIDEPKLRLLNTSFHFHAIFVSERLFKLIISIITDCFLAIIFFNKFSNW